MVDTRETDADRPPPPPQELCSPALQAPGAPPDCHPFLLRTWLSWAPAPGLGLAPCVDPRTPPALRVTPPPGGPEVAVCVKEREAPRVVRKAAHYWGTGSGYTESAAPTASQARSTPLRCHWGSPGPGSVFGVRMLIKGREAGPLTREQARPPCPVPRSDGLQCHRGDGGCGRGGGLDRPPG